MTHYPFLRLVAAPYRRLVTVTNMCQYVNSHNFYKQMVSLHHLDATTHVRPHSPSPSFVKKELARSIHGAQHNTAHIVLLTHDLYRRTLSSLPRRKDAELVGSFLCFSSLQYQIYEFPDHQQQ